MALSMSVRMPAGAAPAARVAGRRVAPKNVHASARVARVAAVPRAASAASRNVTVAAASFSAVKAPIAGARTAFSGSRIQISVVSRVSVRRGTVIVQAKKRSVGDLGEADLKGKRVFVRADLNVPLEKDLTISDDTRIRAAIPTLQYLISKGAKVLLTSHLVSSGVHVRCLLACPAKPVKLSSHVPVTTLRLLYNSYLLLTHGPLP
jgi:hypothetical protein